MNSGTGHAQSWQAKRERWESPQRRTHQMARGNYASLIPTVGSVVIGCVLLATAMLLLSTRA